MARGARKTVEDAGKFGASSDDEMVESSRIVCRDCMALMMAGLWATASGTLWLIQDEALGVRTANIPPVRQPGRQAANEQ